MPPSSFSQEKEEEEEEEGEGKEAVVWVARSRGSQAVPLVCVVQELTGALQSPCQPVVLVEDFQKGPAAACYQTSGAVCIACGGLRGGVVSGGCRQHLHPPCWPDWMLWIWYG